MSTLADMDETVNKGDEFCWKHLEPGRGCEMIRTFHPVGHGAFYTEEFYDENCKLSFCAVYDCGTQKRNFIDKYIKGIFCKKHKIDLLFISHLHNDHINGVTTLLDHCDVKRIVLPALEPSRVIEAILYNYIQNPDFNSPSLVLIKQLLRGQIQSTHLAEIEALSKQQSSSKIVSADSLGRKNPSGTTISYGENIWRYMPINVDNTYNRKLIDRLESAVSNTINILTQDGKVDFQNVKKLVESLGTKKCNNIYKEVFGNTHNAYSMPVFSFSPMCLSSKCTRFCHKIETTPLCCWENCLYMGDFEAKTKFNEFKIAYQTMEVDYSKIRVLQVPHHGSKNNLNDELYKSGKLCIISASENDLYNHPDTCVLCEIQQKRSIPIIVTENIKTKQRYSLNY